jgi:hypothetical protein
MVEACSNLGARVKVAANLALDPLVEPNEEALGE